MQSKVELAKVRDFGEIISDTFLFVRQNIKPLLKYFFTFCGIFVAAGIISASMFQLKWTGTINGIKSGAFNTNEYKPSPFSFFGPEYFLLLFFGMLSFIALIVTFLSYIALYKEKDKQVPTTEEMWGYIKYYFLRVFGSSILLHLLLTVATLLCLVPGIYLSPIFALIFPIMVLENASFSYAFNRSFFLIKDNWWVTFGSLVVIWIIFYVAIMVVSIPTSIINMVSLIAVPQKGGGAFSIPAAVIGAALQQLCQVFAILPITALALCYYNLTESKDGTSLMEKINKLGTITPNTDLPAEEY
ncbi:hypothetical protein [Mucilaginibacter lappiensis]|uniref:Membrane domain of glycerophosphoryl diester phosphodiesterase n=1 Tax=Mucilaginibacter lappiensis TaxID=354630 RepID=A0A1N7GIB5_9SPHI|nr:hypothetical protein [Mucilaginibacter lappiensis]MBB6113069.1 hypothetical protein [Mucilaginibacter lappiensis]MBB6129667.1 hypothetical protein [Mucilaginibacter lappiensis]SIS12248.1 hypothetical protein SAMN05421821_12929 [Mucilaginibacter lappiensis]